MPKVKYITKIKKIAEKYNIPLYIEEKKIDRAFLRVGSKLHKTDGRQSYGDNFLLEVKEANYLLLWKLDTWRWKILEISLYEDIPNKVARQVYLFLRRLLNQENLELSDLQ